MSVKLTIMGQMEVIAREQGKILAPGFTDMTHGLAGAQREQIMRRSALRRLAGVDEVADAVAFLLSDKAQSISGTTLTVDGGATA
jgi:3-oxoacyl-[acyl-carrier protein] reductase